MDFKKTTKVLLFMMISLSLSADKKVDESVAAIKPLISSMNLWSQGTPGFRLEGQIGLYGMKSGKVELNYVERWRSSDNNRADYKGSDYEKATGVSDGKGWDFASTRPTPLRIREFERALQFAQTFSTSRLSGDGRGIKEHSFKAKKAKVDGVSVPCFEQDDSQRLICLDPDGKRITTVFDTPWRIDYSDYSEFHDKSFPMAMKVSEGSRLVLEARLKLADDNDKLPTAPLGAVTRPSCTPSTLDLGNMISSTRPEYPPIAKAMHQTGSVRILAVISESGNVDGPVVISAPSEALAQSALDAVQKWKYTPYRLCGQPVEVETVIVVNFALN